MSLLTRYFTKKTSKYPDLRVEMQRRKTQRDVILEKFIDNEEMTNLELERIAFRYSARIHELRKLGHVFDKSYVRPGIWLYSYEGKK